MGINGSKFHFIFPISQNRIYFEIVSINTKQVKVLKKVLKKHTNYPILMR